MEQGTSSLKELMLCEMKNINGGDDVLVQWEALGDAIAAMNRARDAYSSDQAVGLYQSILYGGREAGIWQLLVWGVF